MQIMNSLKNKNVKKYLVLSVLTIVVLSALIFTSVVIIYNNNKKEILNNYGVEDFSESLAINEIDTKLYIYIYTLIATNTVILLLVTIYFFLALSRNEKEVSNMRKYIKEVSNRDYNLDVQNISESEFSNLQNEIYKIVLELKEKSENLKNDREALSNYLADISHQLRTPLMAITVMTDAIIENENNLDKDTIKFIYEISRQLNQINWLVDSLLKMAQIDTKTVKLHKEKIDVIDLIDIVKNNINIFLEQKNQTIITKIQEHTKVFIDKKWMIEALENIIKNCIEHSKENSKIEIECTNNPLYTEILIEDYGIGIPKEDLPRIFDKFYKGKNSSSNSFGIGLSLAKSIIESQNGEISVESEENKGSVFIIKLYNLENN